MIGVDDFDYSDFDGKTISQVKEMLNKYPDDAELYWTRDGSRHFLQLVVHETLMSDWHIETMDKDDRDL